MLISSSFPGLIGITGKKKSGKDSFFKALQDHGGPRLVRYAFGDDLKSEVAAACDCTVAQIEKDKRLFRPMLQWWGTDFRRNCYGDDYWVRKMERTLGQVGSPSAESGETPGLRPVPVITDVRFLNEAALVKSKGGIIIRVVGGQSEAGDLHRSEVEMDQIQADHLIQNIGTLDDLAQSAKDFLSNWSLVISH